MTEMNKQTIEYLSQPSSASTTSELVPPKPEQPEPSICYSSNFTDTARKRAEFEARRADDLLQTVRAPISATLASTDTSHKRNELEPRRLDDLLQSVQPPISNTLAFTKLKQSYASHDATFWAQALPSFAPATTNKPAKSPIKPTPAYHFAEDEGYKRAMVKAMDLAALSKELELTMGQFRHLPINAYEEAARVLEHELELKSNKTLPRDIKQRMWIMIEEFHTLAEDLRVTYRLDPFHNLKKRTHYNKALLRQNFPTLKDAKHIECRPMPGRHANVAQTIKTLLGLKAAECVSEYVLVLVIAPHRFSALRTASTVEIKLGNEAYPVLIADQLGKMGYKSAFALRRIPPPAETSETCSTGQNLTIEELQQYRFLITVHLPGIMVTTETKYTTSKLAGMTSESVPITPRIEPCTEPPLEIELPPSSSLPFDAIRGLLALGMEPKFSATLRRSDPLLRIWKPEMAEVTMLPKPLGVWPEEKVRMVQVGEAMRKLEDEVEKIMGVRRRLKELTARVTVMSVDVFVGGEFHCAECEGGVRIWFDK
ncbi:hypothetical protein BJ508DRAFT_377718 [Ascobolus immersus RN42]|uniref:Uncharacterized protein n=1 Tax=Ascobolus immersus RN42 TaxID=1160509 RepID=A0A3N4ICC2_ASCIM|nr:hypothetical protein BJ508DRAFT_377718 [Ascobolus immersus RN42]